MKKKRELAPLPRLNGVPTADILQGHKDIHCRITKEQFVRCKMQLFQHGISMGKLIAWLVKEVAEENPHALQLVDALVRNELNRQMASLKRDVKSTKKAWYDDIDQQTLYSMIEEATGVKEMDDDNKDDA